MRRRFSVHRSMLASIAIGMVAASPAGAAVHPIDTQRSRITVHVAKRGLFAFLADNHVVDAPISSGSFDTAARSVELTIDATKMRVLDPTLPADKRSSVQANMEGARVLDAARYPTITFRSTGIQEASPDRWVVAGSLTLHGQTHPITVSVVRRDARRFTGTATVRQTTFGISPIRVAGGTVSVADDVTVEFDVAVAADSRL